MIPVTQTWDPLYWNERQCQGKWSRETCNYITKFIFYFLIPFKHLTNKILFWPENVNSTPNLVTMSGELKARKRGWYCPGPASLSSPSQGQLLKLLPHCIQCARFTMICLFSWSKLHEVKDLIRFVKKSQTWAVGFDHLLLFEQRFVVFDLKYRPSTNVSVLV